MAIEGTFVLEPAALCADDGGSLNPVVAAIYQGENPKAAILSVAIGGNLITLQTFHDPSLKRVSVGCLLIKIAYEWALENNLAEIDFNATNPWVEPYSDRVDEYGQLVLFNRRTPYGKVLEASARLLSEPARGRQSWGG